MAKPKTDQGADQKTDRPKRTRSQIGRSSRRKGHTFERWVANQLKALGFTDAHRQPQSQIKLLKEINATLPAGQKRALTDVVAGCFAIECKHRKVLPKIEDTLKQAEEDSAGSSLLPLAVHKQDGDGRDSILVGIDADLFQSLGGLPIVRFGRVSTLYWKDFLNIAHALAKGWDVRRRDSQKTDGP